MTGFDMPYKAPMAAKPSKQIFDPFNSSSTGYESNMYKQLRDLRTDDMTIVVINVRTTDWVAVHHGATHEVSSCESSSEVVVVAVSV